MVEMESFQAITVDWRVLELVVLMLATSGPHPALSYHLDSAFNHSDHANPYILAMQAHEAKEIHGWTYDKTLSLLSDNAKIL